MAEGAILADVTGGHSTRSRQQTDGNQRPASILSKQVFFNADGNFPGRTSRCTSSRDRPGARWTAHRQRPGDPAQGRAQEHDLPAVAYRAGTGERQAGEAGYASL